MSRRLPGDVTKHIGELSRWKRNRVRSGLPIDALQKSIRLLQEYRELLVDRQEKART